ncbi:MAG: DNA polymerase I [Candidatus Omnitrophota bacterium]
MARPRLFLLDATAFCYRAYYALGELATSYGQPTNAVYGFVNILKKILKNDKPQYLGICFDVSRDTFRQKKFAEYKINRPSMPEGLSSQVPIIKDIISAYRIACFEKEGFEADDLIATLAKKAQENDFDVQIVSSDKDILQLVNERVSVFSPYKDTGTLYNIEKVKERYGVEPRQIIEILTLMGDATDNIPGISGIGEKTATDLIHTFGSLDELLENLDKVKAEKLKSTLKDNISKISLNRELVSLDHDVDIVFDPEKLKVREPDYAKLYKIFKELEFKKMLKDLPAIAGTQDDTPGLGMVDAAGLKLEKELVLYYQDGFFAYAGGKGMAQLGSAQIKDIFPSVGIDKSGHDLKKLKTRAARQEGCDLQALGFDTMIAAYLLNPSKPDYGLCEVAWDYLGCAIDSRRLTPEAACDLIFRLRPVLEARLKETNLAKLFTDIEMPLVEVLADMELAGVKIDLGLLKQLSVDIEKQLIGLIEKIYALAGGVQFNINSPKQLRQVLFDDLKLPVFKKTKSGPSTDEEVLESLGKKHEIARALLEYRKLTKIKSTYVDAFGPLLDRETGRLHASFNQTGTETGRLSSSDPNLQNIPVRTEIGKQVRKAVIAGGKGTFLLSADYSQIELRILAHLCEDENLLAAFKKGEDIHRFTASLIYGCSEDDVSSQMRETAKRINFGIVYGLSGYGLARDLKISFEEANTFIEAYFLRYPGVKTYIEKQIERARSEGYVMTILDRRRYLPEIKNKNMGIRQFAERQAVNTPIQGSAADLIKMAMIGIHRRIRKMSLKSRLILQVHDELVFEVPREESEAMVSLVRENMEKVIELKVPVKAVIKRGSNWLEMEEVA